MLNINHSEKNKQQQLPSDDLQCNRCSMGGSGIAFHVAREMQYFDACVLSPESMYYIADFAKNNDDNWSFRVRPCSEGLFEKENDAWSHYDSGPRRNCKLTGAVFMINYGVWGNWSGPVSVKHVPYLDGSECACVFQRYYYESRRCNAHTRRVHKCELV